MPPLTFAPGRSRPSLAAAGALGLAACSSSPSQPSSAAHHDAGGPRPPRPPRPPRRRRPRRDRSIPVADRSPAGTAGTAPTVTVPRGTPPTPLESADLIIGTGQAAAPGDSVTVQYVLATYSSGKVIQSSWTSQPFTFTLGAGTGDPRLGQGRRRHEGGRAARAHHPPEPRIRGNESPGPRASRPTTRSCSSSISLSVG